MLHHGGDGKQRNNQLYTASATTAAKLEVPEHKHSVTMTRFQAFCCRNDFSKLLIMLILMNLFDQKVVSQTTYVI